MRASVALCNIAAASHGIVGPSVTALAPPRAKRPAPAPQLRTGSEGDGDKTTSETEEEGENQEEVGYSADTGNGNIGGRASGDNVGRASCDNVVASGGRSYWLKSTDILRTVIAGGLVRATGEVKGNLIKAMNNLMCSEETRTELVASNQMGNLFELVHGYTHEVRDIASYNSSTWSRGAIR